MVIPPVSPPSPQIPTQMLVMGNVNPTPPTLLINEYIWIFGYLEIWIFGTKVGVDLNLDKK
jgi:hypothetical protein